MNLSQELANNELAVRLRIKEIVESVDVKSAGGLSGLKAMSEFLGADKKFIEPIPEEHGEQTHKTKIERKRHRKPKEKQHFDKSSAELIKSKRSKIKYMDVPKVKSNEMPRGKSTSLQSLESTSPLESTALTHHKSTSLLDFTS